ncbi:MAG TPA: metallophosphoesterase family protein, partial [Kofleriaceae bacterium]|nr:metallophosphoesterase family protein [Kofleriaceae bacterium]
MSRTIVVGDVHACFDELMRLVELVELAPDDLLVSVGDLVDRGPAPAEVLAYFRTRPNTVVLAGNHERKHVRQVFSYAQEITRLQLGDAYAEHVAWMGTLPYSFENEHVRVVHAALVPGLPLATQPPEILCGSTSGERDLATRVPEGAWYDHDTEDKPIVFGHRVHDEPLVRGGRVFGIDTGACHGGKLTALVAPGLVLHAVPARADYWAEAKQRWQLPVLRAKPWRELGWETIDEQLARFRGAKSDEARAWIAALERWFADVRAVQPAILDAAYRDAEAVIGRGAAQGHPAQALLFQAKSKRLDAASVAKVCTTPAKVVAIAASLGVAVPDFP